MVMNKVVMMALYLLVILLLEYLKLLAICQVNFPALINLLRWL